MIFITARDVIIVEQFYVLYAVEAHYQRHKTTYNGKNKRAEERDSRER